MTLLTLGFSLRRTGSVRPNCRTGELEAKYHVDIKREELKQQAGELRAMCDERHNDEMTRRLAPKPL